MIITALNNKEEEIVLQGMKKEARSKCKMELEDLVKCTKKRTFSMFWACTQERTNVMNCVSQYTTPEILDELKRNEIAKKEKYLKDHGLFPEE